MKLFRRNSISSAVTMMKAVVQNGYGPPVDVLSVKEIPKPKLTDESKVLVRVVSTTVNTPDWASTLGKPYLLRLAFGGLFSPKKDRQLGSDLAGIVEEVGSAVTDLKPGDHVFGSAIENDASSASFAEYAVTDAALLAKKPASLSFDEAAGCVMSGITALKTIRDGAKIKKGSTEILINGASGGVGSFAVQIAKADGAKTVTGVCSGRNVEFVKSLGADHVIDYTKVDYTDPAEGGSRPKKYDVILDNVLNKSYRESRRILKENGIVIPNSIGLDRGNWVGAIPLFIFKPSNYPAVGCDVNQQNLRAIAEMVESGKVKVILDKVYSLDEAPQAVAYMASRRARGQVVIHVSKNE